MAFEQGTTSSDDDICDLMGEHDDLLDHRAPAGEPTDQPPQSALQQRLDRSDGTPHPASPGSSSDSGSSDDSVLLADATPLTDRPDTDDDQHSDSSAGSLDDSRTGHSNGSSPARDPANGFVSEDDHDDNQSVSSNASWEHSDCSSDSDTTASFAQLSCLQQAWC